VVAAVALNHVGGIHTLIQTLEEQQPNLLAFTPLTMDFQNGWQLFWQAGARISGSTFMAYLLVQWWAFRRSDGGGEFIQRLIAVKDEAEAVKAAWLFNILNYVVRTWPWVLVALVAIALYPDLPDWELGYPKLMLDFLPPALLGLVVASLIAAFMSTVSTGINWSASYLTHDLYRRFIQPDAPQHQLVWVGRLASVLVTALGAIAAFYINNVTDVFRLVIAIGTGPGLVLILRWFWWRINAAAELAAMVVGFIIGLITSSNSLLRIEDFGWRLMVTTFLTAAFWVTVMYLTPPESDATLDHFYQRVQPGGPGWQRQRQRTGIPPRQDLKQDLQRVLAAMLLLFGTMFAIGGFLLLQPVTGWTMLVTAVSGWLWLRQLDKKVSAMPRPGLLEPGDEA